LIAAPADYGSSTLYFSPAENDVECLKVYAIPMTATELKGDDVGNGGAQARAADEG
jgi:hypothetical protein